MSSLPIGGLESAKPENLTVANRVADSVICLPMYHGLSDEDIVEVIKSIQCYI